MFSFNDDFLFLNVIRSHPDHAIKLGMRTLGKEYVLETIAKETGEEIGVYPARFQQNILLDRPKVYQKISDQTRIHCVNIAMVKKTFALNYENEFFF